MASGIPDSQPLFEIEQLFQFAAPSWQLMGCTMDATLSNQNTLISSTRTGGESVSQPPLKDKVFPTFRGQNPPFEQRPENGVSPPTKACNAVVRDW
jgi:hypothetical protein